MLATIVKSLYPYPYVVVNFDKAACQFKYVDGNESPELRITDDASMRQVFRALKQKGGMTVEQTLFRVHNSITDNNFDT
jgi:hypothetical protein